MQEKVITPVRGNTSRTYLKHISQI